MENQEMNVENKINPSPFDALSESDLIYLLEHNKESLTEAQIIDIQSRINRLQNNSEDLEYTLAKEKQLTLMPPKKTGRAGYVDIIILMLTTWITCLCGMAYIYSRLNIIG